MRPTHGPTTRPRIRSHCLSRQPRSPRVACLQVLFCKPFYFSGLRCWLWPRGLVVCLLGPDMESVFTFAEIPTRPVVGNPARRRSVGMPVSCPCAACALGALRPPLIIGGRTSGGAFASGSVSPPVARDQLHAPSPGASLAGAYVLEATTAPPERGWTQSGIRLPAAKRPPGAQLAYERTEPTVGAARCLRAGSHRNGTGRLLRRHI